MDSVPSRDDRPAPAGEKTPRPTRILARPRRRIVASMSTLRTGPLTRSGFGQLTLNSAPRLRRMRERLAAQDPYAEAWRAVAEALTAAVEQERNSAKPQ